MTASNEHLDRAIEAGTKAVCGTADKLIIADRRKQRIYARALIASVREQIAMARKPYLKTRGADYNAGVAVGFMVALLELRKFSIVEGEAIEPLPADFAKVWDDNPEGLYES